MRRYLAELVGTFVLVLGGVGAAVLAGAAIGPVGISLAFGLSLVAMIYTVGPISGAHLNPAVTFGLWLAGKFESRDVSGYIAAQVLGGLLATLALFAVVQGSAAGFDPEAFGANGYGQHSPQNFGLGAAFLVEALLTGVLVFTVLGSTDRKAPVGFAGLSIGLVLALVHLVGMQVTNVSVNPARSIGPAVFVGGWGLAQLWLFVVAPLVGSALGAGAWALVRPTEAEPLAARDAERALDAEQHASPRGRRADALDPLS